MDRFHLRLRGTGLVLLLLLLFPAPAEAHSDLRMGAFAGGILHPLEVPGHLLILVAMGLRLGQFPPFQRRTFLAIFAPVAAVALLVTPWDATLAVPQPLLFGIALAVGGLISSGSVGLRWVNPALLVIVALAIGLDSGTGGAPAMITAKALFATWVCLLVVIGYIAFYISLLPPRKWVEIGVRILGSWIVAISLLMLAFYFKKR